MSFDSHQINTGLKKYERRTFGIGKNIVGAINAGMYRSGISSSSSSLSGPGTGTAVADCRGGAGDGRGWTVRSGGGVVSAISVVAECWRCPDDEETVEPSDGDCSSSWKNGSTSCGFSGSCAGSTGSMREEDECCGDGGSGSESGSASPDPVSGRMSSSLCLSSNGLIGTGSSGSTTAGETGVATSTIGECTHPPGPTFTSK